MRSAAILLYFCRMKKWGLYLVVCVMFALIDTTVSAQCAMCTKTAQQLGEKPAQGLNSGILYLMMAPFAIVGFIGYRWWKNQGSSSSEELTDNPSA